MHTNITQSIHNWFGRLISLCQADVHGTLYFPTIAHLSLSPDEVQHCLTLVIRWYRLILDYNWKYYFPIPHSLTTANCSPWLQAKSSDSSRGSLSRQQFLRCSQSATLQQPAPHRSRFRGSQRRCLSGSMLIIALVNKTLKLWKPSVKN